MEQRVSRRSWYSSAGAERRPRLLVEDGRPALEISDFGAFRDAGFDVAFCSGPGVIPGSCPLLRGAECEVAAQADVVLHGLGPDSGVAAAIRWWYPELPVVVQGGPDVPACCSVRGQVEAVRRALQDTARNEARPSGQPDQGQPDQGQPDQGSQITKTARS